MNAAPALALALAALFATRAANAQNTYQPYPVGGRATGMGGAATALADDTAGAFYNPAGTAFAEGNSLSVSTSLYGLLAGRSVDAFGNGTDFSYGSVNIVPSATASLTHLGHSTPEHPSRWVLGFGVFAPLSTQIDERTSLNHDATTISITLDEWTLLAGPSIGWRVSDRFALGLSVSGAYHSMNSQVDLTDTATGAGRPLAFFQRTANLTQRDGGLVLAAGARWEPVPGLTIGLSVRSPTIALTGGGTAFTRAVAIPSGGGPAMVLAATDASVTTRSIIPLRAALGVAYTRRGRFAVAADVTFHAPVSYAAFTSETDPTLNQTVDHRAVVNVALGLEYYLRPTLPLRAGFFTDLSPAPTPTLGGSNEDHVDLAGLTLALGIISAHTQSQLGVVCSAGNHTLAGIDLVSGSYDTRISSGSQYRVYVVYAGSYNF